MTKPWDPSILQSALHAHPSKRLRAAVLQQTCEAAEPPSSPAPHPSRTPQRSLSLACSGQPVQAPPAVPYPPTRAGHLAVVGGPAVGRQGGPGPATAPGCPNSSRRLPTRQLSQTAAKRSASARPLLATPSYDHKLRSRCEALAHGSISQSMKGLCSGHWRLGIGTAGGHAVPTCLAGAAWASAPACWRHHASQQCRTRTS